MSRRETAMSITRRDVAEGAAVVLCMSVAFAGESLADIAAGALPGWTWPALLAAAGAAGLVGLARAVRAL